MALTSRSWQDQLKEHAPSLRVGLYVRRADDPARLTLQYGPDRSMDSNSVKDYDVVLVPRVDRLRLAPLTAHSYGTLSQEHSTEEGQTKKGRKVLKKTLPAGAKFVGREGALHLIRWRRFEQSRVSHADLS